MAAKPTKTFYTDPGDVPDEIINGFDPKRKAQDHAAFKAVARRSNFNILINPNVSHKGLDSAGRKHLAARLIKAKNALTEQLVAGKFIKDKGYGIPKLLGVEGEPEIGQKHGFIHIAINYRFDEYCHLDYHPIRELIVACMAPLNPAVKFRYFQDKGAVESAYATKSRNDMEEHVQQVVAGTYKAPQMIVQPSGLK